MFCRRHISVSCNKVLFKLNRLKSGVSVLIEVRHKAKCLCDFGMTVFL